MIYGSNLIDNKYQIIREIGAGGTGVVYLAFHTTLRKYVVLKKIKNGTFNEDMLRKEADLLKNLHHTYLPTVYDYIAVGQDVYTVIDYIEGSSMEDIITSGQIPDMPTIKRWFTQLAEVLEYLHSRTPQIIHSDIKPANILITPDNNVCLIDFNISLDGSADVSGFSRYYASPEQIRCAYFIRMGAVPDCKVDARTDIYSLGATFYHLLSGYFPSDESPNLPLTQLFQTNDVFMDIVDRCMITDPESRVQSSAALVRLLRNSFKLSKNYKILNFVRWMSVTLGAVLVCAGIVMCVYGGQLKNTDSFKKNYDEVFTLYKEGKYEEAFEKGRSLINSSGSKEYFKENKSLKADLFHIIASSGYERENYEDAADYHKKGFDTDGGKNANYYYEYVSSLLKLGRKAEALQALNDGERYGMQHLQQSLIEMELMLDDHNCDEILAFYEQQSSDSSFKNHPDALIMCADACTKEKRFTQALEYCRYAYDLSGSNRVLRKLGEACVDVSNAYIDSGDDQQAENYCREAATYFESLMDNNYSLCSDHINLLRCYERLGKNQEAEAVITQMIKEYPNDHRALAEAAIFYNRTSRSQTAAEYAEKAKKCMPANITSEIDRYYQSSIDEILN